MVVKPQCINESPLKDAHFIENQDILIEQSFYQNATTVIYAQLAMELCFKHISKA